MLLDSFFDLLWLWQGFEFLWDHTIELTIIYQLCNHINTTDELFIDENLRESGPVGVDL